MGRKMGKIGRAEKAGSLFLAVAAAAAIVVALPMTVSAQETKTSNGTWTYNGYDYELWSENNAGTTSMILNGDDGSGANAKGGTFSATWSNTINILFRAGRKFSTTQGGTIGGREPPKTALAYGNISVDFAATWSSTDNVKMLGIYGWAFYAQGSIPTKDENGNNKTFSNQIEYYIIQDRGSYNAATGGDTKSTLKGEATIDGILYEFRVCDRIDRNALTGSSVSFKQYFSVPKSQSSHRQSGTISVSKHFAEWAKAGMLMDGPLYEVAMKVESYTGSGGNANGTATITKNLLTIGDPIPADHKTLTVTASPASGGKVTRTPDSASYSPNKNVSVEAVPNTGWKFDGWSGDATGTTNPLPVILDTDKNITAKFTMISDDPTNLIVDGNFPGSSLTSYWTYNVGQYYGNSAGTSSVSGNKVTLNITTAGADTYQPQLIQQGIALDNGLNYKLTFKASSAAVRPVDVIIQRVGQDSEGWTTYAQEEFDLTAAEQTYTLSFKMTEASDPGAQLAFNLGGSGMSGTNVIISDVKLVRVMADGGGNSINNKTLGNLSARSGLRLVVKQTSGSALNVSFTAKNGGKASIKMYSLKGNVVSQAKVKPVADANYTHTFKTAKLPPGFYLIEVSGKGFAAERAKIAIK